MGWQRSNHKTIQTGSRHAKTVCHFIAVFSSNAITRSRCFWCLTGTIDVLSSVTWSKRQGTQELIYNHITDSTYIAKVTLKKLISHTKTKAELTAFWPMRWWREMRLQGSRSLWRGRQSAKQNTRTWAICRATTTKRTQRLSSMRRTIQPGATPDSATELSIYSPDTDVLVLAIRCYAEMCVDQL